MSSAKKSKASFGSEAELCAAFIGEATQKGAWHAYAETAGFDILMVRVRDGIQIGIEAKLTLNAKVILQGLPKEDGYFNFGEVGPHYRAILVPVESGGIADQVCERLGLTVIRQHPLDVRFWPKFRPQLPDPASEYHNIHWQEWLPQKPCEVPDYLPDVSAGASAPVALTLWKIAAIKLAVLLEERPVTRADFKALKLSPTRWTDRYTGWLNATSEGYVKGSRMPDFKAQHPRNYEEIRADRAKGAPKAVPIQLPLVASQSTRVPETALEQQGRG